MRQLATRGEEMRHGHGVKLCVMVTAIACLVSITDQKAMAEGTKSEGPLLPPFTERELPDKAPSAADLKCDEDAPKPQKSLSVSSMYDQTDESRSLIDKKAKATYDEKMEYVRDFNSEIVRFANDYHIDGNLTAAGCALEWMDYWARGGGLTELETRQAALSSSRILAGLSMAYLQVRSLAHFAQYETSGIENWLATMAENVLATLGDPEDRKSNRQNHRYWAGFAVAAAGIATGRKDFLEWGLDSYEIGACQIDEKGALPLEMDRGKRARDYHNHALAPLIMLAEIGEHNGQDTYASCDGRLHDLVRFVLESVEDPGTIEEIAGKKQIDLPMKDGFLRKDRFAWIEPYRSRFDRHEKLFEDLNLDPPLFSSNLGGDTTALYGSDGPSK